MKGKTAMKERKLTLYISMSLDGFLATKDDDISWLSMVEQPGEDYGYYTFTEQVDTYIVGNQTYETVMKLTGGEFPQAKQYDCYVITRQSKEPVDGITYYSGDIKTLVTKLKNKPGGTIYCDGGGQIVKLLMEHNHIDEYIISIIPIILGDGKRLFHGGIEGFKLKAQDCKKYDSGLVQLTYTKN
ncbi:MAG: dihydrofolate reductase [Cyclobacteriaceae bacterium]